jgi:hypothetical protein
MLEGKKKESTYKPQKERKREREKERKREREKERKREREKERKREREKERKNRSNCCFWHLKLLPVVAWRYAPFSLGSDLNLNYDWSFIYGAS